MRLTKKRIQKKNPNIYNNDKNFITGHYPHNNNNKINNNI